jgi:hypothetical protein
MGQATMIGEVLKPKVEPPLPKQFVAVARWLQATTVIGSIYVLGVVAAFHGLSRKWFYEKVVVSPLQSFATAIGATLVAMSIMLVVRRRRTYWHPGKPLYYPLLVMAVVTLIAVGVVAASTLLLYLEWLLLSWMVHQGVFGWILAAVVGVYLGFITVVLIVELAGTVVWVAVDCVQFWFGAAHLHPMLPPIAMLLYAAAQVISYVDSSINGELAARSVTYVVYIVTFGAPTCLAAVAAIQLCLLRKAGVRLSGLRVRRSGPD